MIYHLDNKFHYFRFFLGYSIHKIQIKKEFRTVNIVCVCVCVSLTQLSGNNGNDQITLDDFNERIFPIFLFRHVWRFSLRSLLI